MIFLFVGITVGTLVNYFGHSFIWTYTTLSQLSWNVSSERTLGLVVFAAYVSLAAFCSAIAVHQLMKRGFRPMGSFLLGFALSFIGYLMFTVFAFAKAAVL
jgi:hypothetical protein